MYIYMYAYIFIWRAFEYKFIHNHAGAVNHTILKQSTVFFSETNSIYNSYIRRIQIFIANRNN